MAAFLVIITLLFMWSSSGNKAEIETKPKAAETSALRTKYLYSKYIGFIYSGKYLAKQQPATGQDLELYMLSADTQYDKQLAVSVSQLPNGQLSNNSAYNLRQSQPSVYTTRQVKVGEATYTVWVKKDNSEQTVIIPKGDKVAILAFTTSGPSDNLQPEVDALLGTFHWN